MSVVEGLNLVFFGDDHVYRVGETLSGAVQFRLSGPRNFKAVEVNFNGDCRVHFPGEKQQNRQHASEQYLKHTIILWKEDISPPLSHGDQTFQFQFTLPVNIPSSFEGLYGKVRYKAKAVLQTSWYRLNITFKKNFSILNTLNMNELPNIHMPLTASKEKKVFYELFRRDLVSLCVTINQGGFVVGEPIHITIKLSNDCDCELNGTVCRLMQKTIFRTSCERHEKLTIAEVRGNRVGPKQQDQWQSMIVVPQIPESNLRFCRLIDVEYYLKVSVCGVHMSVKLPLCVGNVPICRPQQVTGPQHFPSQQWAQQPGMLSTFPVAPVVFPTAMPPVNPFNPMLPYAAYPAQDTINPNMQLQFQGSPGHVPSALFQSPPMTAIGDDPRPPRCPTS
uniref:Arrestin C-terminal-like domain-containing protein n=1 Tax=Eptatretus burgeri TaxID=7764 RepID=A0A8C4N5A0_EPTBU